MKNNPQNRAPKPAARRNIGRWVLYSSLGLVALCLSLGALVALQNRNLPLQSEVIDRLSQAEKARVREAFHLRENLGDVVWPGWGQADIPIIVYNEAYAFLMGYPDPPDGWVRVPQMQTFGGPWEAVPDDSFEGQPYYRQPLPGPGITPQAFTVLVGDRWTASLQTMEYARVAFYQGFPEQILEPLRPFFPYTLMWSFLGGDTEVYLGGLEHEAFHAYQGRLSFERLKAAELATGQEGQYPWSDQASAQRWQTELESLAKAIQAESQGETVRLAGNFLAARQARRAETGLAPVMIDYERQREWLEGLAKYAELTTLREAATRSEYEPVLSDDPHFEAYAGVMRYYNQQLQEVRRTAAREGETRFYYSGMAQALLLDRLAPSWKEQVLNPGVWLEDLLAEAVGAAE